MRTAQARTLIGIITLAFVSPIPWFPSNFWLVFSIPAIIFLILGFVAIGSWKHKEVFFKCSDYFYYAFIVGVVVLGSKYILHPDKIDFLDAFIEKKTLQQRLKQIEVELPVLRERLKWAQSSEKLTDPKFVERCQIERFEKQLRRPKESPENRIWQLDLCEGYWATVDQITILPARISSLEQDKTTSAAKLKDLEFGHKTSISESKTDPSINPDLLTFEFLWIPGILLGGVALKLAKTTCSLCPLPRGSGATEPELGRTSSRGTMTAPNPSVEVHTALPAADRDEKSPVWDMSQERMFIESTLNQRFSFFLVIFSLVIAGAINSEQQLNLQTVLTVGLVIEITLAMLLARSQEKLDLILADLYSDPSHPATIINLRAKPTGSRRRLVGVWIPRACCVFLCFATAMAWLGLLSAT